MRAALQLVRGYLRHRPLAALLSIGLLALGTGLMSLLLLLDRQLSTQFERNLAGIDLVIGAKGSPLQLVTSSIYHADAPTGNIPIKKVKAFGNPKHPLIENAIPLGLGDSYGGRRIVGTTLNFERLYDAKLATGTSFKEPFDVSIGANIARQLSLNVGDTFHSTHGLDDNPDLAHADGKPFQVTGIYASTGLVIDDLILTSLETVWAVHDHAHGEQEVEADHHDHDQTNEAHGGHAHHEAPTPWYEQTDQDITALLATFSARNTATLNFARNVNENTDLMAASPAVVINQFSTQIASAEDLLRGLATVLVVASIFSLLIILLNALRERFGDLSLMRALGASPGFVFMLVLIESACLALVGAVIGLVLGRLGLLLLSKQLGDSYPVGITNYSLLTEEFWIILGSVVAALIAALVPAIQAYRVDPGLTDRT